MTTDVATVINVVYFHFLSLPGREENTRLCREITYLFGHTLYL